MPMVGDVKTEVNMIIISCPDRNIESEIQHNATTQNPKAERNSFTQKHTRR